MFCLELLYSVVKYSIIGSLYVCPMWISIFDTDQPKLTVQHMVFNSNLSIFFVAIADNLIR